MMSYHQAPSPPHLYSQAIQLKLYQAFIFSIPILFSIILFLLFYLFYLKRRTSNISSPPPTLPVTLNQATPFSPLSEMGLKGNLKDKLSVILFDENLRMRDSQCCVCLGEFEIKEELHQIPSCKHVFHADCIRHWLGSNSTCPLCRRSVVTVTKHGHSHPLVGPDLARRDDDNNNNDNDNINQNPQTVVQEQQEQLVSIPNCLREHLVIAMEGSTSTSIPVCMDNDTSHLNEVSVVSQYPNP